MSINMMGGPSTAGMASDAWGAVAETDGGVAAAVIAFFAQRGNEAAKKVQDAIAKAKRDSQINKGLDAAKGEMIQNGGDATVTPNGALYQMLSAAASKGNAQAKELAAAVATGKLTSAQFTAANSFIADQKSAMGSATGGGGVNDDSVNMVLVQIAYQEFNNAISGGSSAAKSHGDTQNTVARNF